MKLNKYIWLTALPMLLSACQEDALVDNPQLQNGKFVIKASMDEKASFSRAQIKLDETEDGRTYGAFQWDEGDKFRMYEITGDGENSTISAMHDFEISGYSNTSPSTSATFVSETTPTDGTRFYAYYPLIDANEDGQTITMVLDSILTDNTADSWNEYFNKNMYMMAEGEIRGAETALYFQHRCGLINVSYTNESGSSKFVKGISLDGKWSTSRKVYINRPWSCIEEKLDEDGYGISFEKPVEVVAGAEENFFILFMQPNGEAKKMSKLSIVYSDESNSSTETKTTDSYTVGMPTFFTGDGYRLNVKHTAENELVWAKAPAVEGYKVSTPDALVAALVNQTKIALGANIALKSTLMIDKDITLDLAGFKLTNDEADLTGFSKEKALIVVKRGAHLTINDASGMNTGVIEPYSYDEDSLTITIKMVSVDDTGDELAQLTVNAGFLEGHHTIAGTQGKGNTKIVINGGDIRAGNNGGIGIIHPQNGILQINGGEITGGPAAIEIGAGNIEIKGGRIYQNKSGGEKAIALYISQGSDNLPLNVTIEENANVHCWDDISDWNGAYAIYEEDLHNNGTDNVSLVIQNTRGITGHIYSENKKGFIGSNTSFNSPSALSYIAPGAKNVEVYLEDRYGDYHGPTACIPDSEAENGAEVTVDLNGKTWTIESIDADNNYFYVGKNNKLTLCNGIVCVPEDATGLSLVKGNNAELNFRNVTINSYNVHYAVNVEDGKTIFQTVNVIAGDNCYAFNIMSTGIENEGPVAELYNRCNIDGNFRFEIKNIPSLTEYKFPPVLSIDETTIDGNLYVVGDETTNDWYNKWLLYCVYREKESVKLSEGSTGWESVQNATDDEPATSENITDLNWIAVIEANYNGELTFVKNRDGYVDVKNLTNQEIIESITEINFSDDIATNLSLDYSKIEELQFIEKFKALETLNLRETSVDTLDLSNNTELTNVTISKNKLTSLNFAGCNKLDQIICTEDYLTALDLGECGESLTYVSLNLPSMTDLDVSNCQILERLRIDESNLSDFTLPETTKVKYLELQGASIKSLNVNQSMGVEYLYCYLPFGLTSLDLSDCDDLKEVSFYSNGGGDYKYDISAINVEGCDNLTKFGFSEFNNNSEIEAAFSNCPSLETLSIFDCKTLDITGCNSLKTLGCSGGSLTTLNVSSCANLQVLRCGSNQLTELVFPENSILSDLSCANNNFTKLDVTNLSQLTTLWCQNNQLTELNVEGLTNLEELICSDNQLTSLSVKALSSLKTLECGFNKLTSLDVSNMTSLEKLDFYYNDSDMELLNLSGLSCITELNLMDYNAYGDTTYKIKELNVSNCPNLTKITFYEGIGIEVLDISSRNPGILPDNPNLLEFGNTTYAKGLKVLKLDQWHFDWYDSIYGVWGSFTSGDQTFDETYPRPYYYKGYPYPRFEYPNGYTSTTVE